jgi:hypothetical protein
MSLITPSSFRKLPAFLIDCDASTRITPSDRPKAKGPRDANALAVNPKV